MVYVDDAKIEYGQMFMFHMIADSTAELIAMVDTIRETYSKQRQV